jgi:hypothetical protein
MAAWRARLTDYEVFDSHTRGRSRTCIKAAGWVSPPVKMDGSTVAASGARTGLVKKYWGDACVEVERMVR